MQALPGTFSTDQLHHVRRRGRARAQKGKAESKLDLEEKPEILEDVCRPGGHLHPSHRGKHRSELVWVFGECSARGTGNRTWILPLIYQGGGLDDCGIENVLL